MKLVGVGRAAQACMALTAVVAAAGCGGGDGGDWVADLRAVNDSGVEGQARFSDRGNELDVVIEARGLAPDRVHQQRIHGPEPGSSRCPRPSDDLSGNGLIFPSEARRSLGQPVFELAPYPTLGEDGRLSFRLTYITDLGQEPERRAYTVPDGALPLEGRTVVLYGLDGGSRYEPEVPVACGEIRGGGPGANVTPGEEER